MEMGMKLDETINGLTYKDRAFMIAGYIKDYKPQTILGEVLDETSESDKKISDFKENRGYVDNDGYVWIYRADPKSSEIIPWFTVTFPDGVTPKLVFNPNRGWEEEAFHISRVGDLSIKEIISNTDDKPIEYDPEVIASVQRATAFVQPVIKDEDDFLKKLVKQTIISKRVNVKKYAKKVPKPWILHNLIQSTIISDTKCSPPPFLQWMELLDCDFKIIITDNGHDKEDPLRKEVMYDSVTDKITVGGEEFVEVVTEEMEESDEDQ